MQITRRPYVVQTGAVRSVFFKVCESIIAPLVYISWPTAWATWLLHSSRRAQLSRWSKVVLRVLPAEVTQSARSGFYQSLLGRGVLHGNPLAFLVICKNRFDHSIVVLPGKVGVAPLAVAVRRPRTVACVAQHRADFQRLEWRAF